MGVWIRLSKLTDTGIGALRDNPKALLDRQTEIVESEGGRFLSIYVTLGYFDIISLLEVPDDDTLKRIEKKLGENKYYVTQTLAAVPAESFAGAFGSNPQMGLFLENWLQVKKKRS
jgi:uncharacterized protein with GYD domain